MKIKKIVFIRATLLAGGAERVILLLATELLARGYEIEVILTENGKTPQVLPPQISVHSQNNMHKSKMLRAVKSLFFLVKEMWHSDADTFISFCASSNIVALLANFFVWKRIIVSERGNPYFHKKLIKFLENILYHSAHRVVIQTPDALAFFPQYVQRKSRIILNPITAKLPVFEGSERRKEIVSTCRLEKLKNLPMLIEAFSLLSLEFPDYRLGFYGEGEELSALKALSLQKGVANRVDFHGFSENLFEQVFDAAMFVLPSNTEGISNSMLEAMAMGIPTICTDCPVGGARMMISDHENGLLIPVGDVKALYNAMKELLDDPALAKRISSKALNLREKLTIEKITDQWVEVIESE